MFDEPTAGMGVGEVPIILELIQAIKDQGTANDEEAHVRLWILLALSEMPKGGDIPVWAANRNLDNWSKKAFTRAAAGAGVIETATRPIPKSLHAVEAPIGVLAGDDAPLRHHGLKFSFQRGDLVPIADRDLAAGELIVMDLLGQVATRSSYDGSRWSSNLSGLGNAVYVYIFQGRNGHRREGKIHAHPWK